ncbi:DUF2829 domain-containing protein [Bradyrhizobium sp. 188]|nr:DUF2829 domain-containing protein [Bradyrhizobium sp. 188]
MNFSDALNFLKAGRRLTRLGWNGNKDRLASGSVMFIVLMPRLQLPPYNTQDTARKVNDRTAKWIGEDQPLDCQPYFAMYTASKLWQPGWLASQADMLADDWACLAE